MDKKFFWIKNREDLAETNVSSKRLCLSGKKFKNLTDLKSFTQLEELILNSIKLNDFGFLINLKSLNSLTLENVTSLKDNELRDIGHLCNLEELVIQTPPGWDGSGKYLIYKDIEWIVNLKKLQRLILLDVRFESKDLSLVLNLSLLEELTIDGKHNRKQIAEIDSNFPKLDFNFKNGYKRWDGFEYKRCEKCNNYKIEFAGSELKRRVLCQQCQSEKVNKLILEYNSYKG